MPGAVHAALAAIAPEDVIPTVEHYESQAEKNAVVVAWAQRSAAFSDYFLHHLLIHAEALKPVRYAAAEALHSVAVGFCLPAPLVLSDERAQDYSVFPLPEALPELADCFDVQEVLPLMIRN